MRLVRNLEKRRKTIEEKEQNANNRKRMVEECLRTGKQDLKINDKTAHEMKGTWSKGDHSRRCICMSEKHHNESGVDEVDGDRFDLTAAMYLLGQSHAKRYFSSPMICPFCNFLWRTGSNQPY